MTDTIQSPYTSQQIAIWLRGLLTIAWADGHFDDEEQNLIISLADAELSDLDPSTLDTSDTSNALEPISPAELSAALSHDAHAAENFLRMAVMVALADGAYSADEDALLSRFCQALGLEAEVLGVLRLTLGEPCIDQPSTEPAPTVVSSQLSHSLPSHDSHADLLHPVRDWFDNMDVHDPRLARFLCKLIPSQCPFERDINLFGRRVAHIPPLCKLNPLYEQFVGLRFRALSYLADECGEDVSSYC